MSPSSVSSDAMLESLLGDLMVGVTRGTARGRRVLCDRRLRVGSAADNDLVLVDDGVVAHHYELVREGTRLSAHGLASAGELRTRADSQTTLLTVGSRLRVGQAELLVHRSFNPARVIAAEEDRFGPVIGRSEDMRLIFGVLAEVGPTDLGLLIQGESGTGKRLMARAVHDDGPRQMGPFVVVDCASDPQLVECELFGGGGEAGPLPGALEVARGGTLVLDQVADLPLDVQARLMQVCESRSLCRVPGGEPVAIDVRVVSTSRRPLSEEVRRGKFRADLYFCLSAAAVSVCPLRDRREDLPILVEHILAGLRRREVGFAGALSQDLLGMFEALDWPGNVRELKHALEQGLGLGSTVRPGSWSPGPSYPPGFQPEASYRQTRAAFQSDFEQRYVQWLLERHQGNISAAAREAKMDRKHLYDLARKHGLRFSSRPP